MQRALLKEAAPFREGHEAFELRHQHVGVGQAGHELPRAGRLREELALEGFDIGVGRRHEGSEVALVHEGAREATQRAPFAPRADPFEGDALVEGLEQHVVAPGQAFV